MTWPQALRLGDGLTDLWDAKQNAWILHWDYIQTLRDPLDLFQAPILYPARYALAFSENLYGEALFGFPLLASGMPIVANYNVVFLLGMAFSAWSAWLLARDITGDPAASLIAGLIYAFVPWRFSQLPHINMQWGGFLCLLLMFLLRYLDFGRRRDLMLFGACFVWNILATLHFGLFSGFLVGVTLVFDWISGAPHRAQRILAAASTVAAATLLCAPFLVPYKIVETRYGMRRGMDEMRAYSGRLADFLSAGYRNRLYGVLTRRWSRAEADFFPGALPVVLAAAAVVGLRRRRPRPEARHEPPSPARRGVAHALDALILLAVAASAYGLLRGGTGEARGHPSRFVVIATVLILVRLSVAFPDSSRFRDLRDCLQRQRLDRRAILMLCVGVAGIVVALGAHTPYYRVLYFDMGSVFHSIRVPARAIVLFHIALSVLAAWGLSLLVRRLAPGRRAVWVGAALALLVVEYRAFPLGLSEYDPRLRPVDAWLRSDGGAGAILELPLGFPYDCEWMLRQAVHGKPILNGHQSYLPPAYEDLIRAARRDPIAPAAWDLMSGLGAESLVFHGDVGEPEERARYGRLIREGIADGRIRAVRSFGDGDASTFVFRLVGGREAGSVGRPRGH